MATKSAKPQAAPAAPPAAAPAPKKKSKLIPLIAVAAILLVGGGGGAWWFLHQSKAEAATEDGEKKVGDKKKPAPVFVTLEPFTVNLQDEDGGHYLQVGIVLEVGGNAVSEAIKEHMPVIRNGILLLLSSKRSNDISTLKGKQALADEIATTARTPLASFAEPTRGVEKVYFSSFVIQ